MHDEEPIKQNPSTPSDSAQDDNQDVGRRTQDERERCEEYLNGWKRAQADYANLKKEIDKKQIEMSVDMTMNIVSRLLPALDQIENALKYLPELNELNPEKLKQFQNWAEGLRSVKALWEKTFRDLGIIEIPVNGSFKPQLHEAIGIETKTDGEADSITRVVRRGWMLDDVVIRPAQVIVNHIENQS